MENTEETTYNIETNSWDNIISELNSDLHNNLNASYIENINTVPDELFLIDTSLVSNNPNIILLSASAQANAPIIYSVTLNGNSSPVVFQASDIIERDDYPEVTIDISDIDDDEERIFYLFSVY